MVKQSIELTDEEVKEYIDGEELQKLVGKVATRVGYPPAGYGCDDRKITPKNGVLYAEWERYSSCD